MFDLLTAAGVAASSAPSVATPPVKSPVLKLLEKKKKGQRSGLYQWVLWREAIKGEHKRTSPESPSTADNQGRVFRNLNKTLMG